MSTRSRTVDWGGLDLIVRGLLLADKPGQAGTASTISATELGFLDAVTAGTAAASKALVLDSSKGIGTITSATITTLTAPNLAGAVAVAGVATFAVSPVFTSGITAATITTLTAPTIAGATTMSGAISMSSTLAVTGAISGPRVVVADAAFASPTLLTAAQSGALCVFDETAGSIFTLPAAAAGLWYDFVIAVASSSNHHRVACTSGDFLLGSIMSHATDDTGLSSAYAANGTTHLAIQLDSDAVGRLAGGKFRVTAISASQWVIQGDLLATGTVATPFETS